MFTARNCKKIAWPKTRKAAWRKGFSRVVQAKNCKNDSKTTLFLVTRSFLRFLFAQNSCKNTKKRLETLVSSLKCWSCWADSNCRPHPYQGCALPTELQQQMATKKGLEPSTSGVTGRRSNQLNYLAIAPTDLWEVRLAQESPCGALATEGYTNTQKLRLSSNFC